MHRETILLESLSEIFFSQLMNNKNFDTQSESILLSRARDFKASDKHVLRINRLYILLSYCICGQIRLILCWNRCQFHSNFCGSDFSNRCFAINFLMDCLIYILNDGSVQTWTHFTAKWWDIYTHTPRGIIKNLILIISNQLFLL